MPTLINLLILILVVTSSAISIRSVEKDISKVDYRLSRPADRFGKFLDLPEVNYKWYNESLLAVAIDTKDNSVCGSAEFGFADKDKVEYAHPEAKGAWLRVEPDNEFAIKAYKAVGFKDIETGNRYFGTYACVLGKDCGGGSLDHVSVPSEEDSTRMKEAVPTKNEDIEENLVEFKRGVNFRKMFNSGKTEVFSSFTDYVKMSVPAICYAIQKNALYLAITHLQAAVFQITYQGKILTTALFSVLILHKRLSQKQVLSLIVLLIGVSIVQLSQLKEKDDSSQKDNASLLVGIIAILFACMTSGFAAVYFEYMLKRGSFGKDGAPNVQKPYTLWVRNFQLASFASTSAICTMLIKDHTALRQNGFFYGYSPLTWTTIFLEAGGGLIVAVVIKYADTILKNFATAAAIISSTTISALFLGFEVRPTFIIGAVLVIVAIYMYSSKPAEPSDNKGYDKLDSMETGKAAQEMIAVNDAGNTVYKHRTATVAERTV
ncbi:hypothetical protein FOL47_007684 [Perkinsus chesapeaki]|uniref:Uncharacterized protein n=1 Tax=Perkinsus chesapeaki TaxID=330153 RepID=A0A7J6LIW2_PERCH|nr:hypothetical protein FOL47_007684 [Perkinsus chesapeaki]